MSAAVQGLPGMPEGGAAPSRAERMGELMDCADAIKAICKGLRLQAELAGARSDRRDFYVPVVEIAVFRQSLIRPSRAGVLPGHLSTPDLERLSVVEGLAYAADVLSERMAGLLEDFEAFDAAAQRGKGAGA